MPRRADPSDIPDMVEMARKFFVHSGLAQWFEFDPGSFAEQVARLIDHDDGCVLISERGMMGAMAYPCWFNRGHKTAQELFWWSEDGRGLDMLDAMEEWARSRGCRTLEMGALGSGERLARFYERRGYAPKERLFVRRL